MTTGTDDDAGSEQPIGYLHPVVDDFGDGYVVYATRSRTVRMTRPLALFLSDARDFGLRPVLATRADAVVSVFVSHAMRQARGVWAVQQRDRSTFDGLSGYRIDRIEDLFGPVDTSRDRLPGFPRPGIPVRMLTWDVTAYRRVAASTRIGTLAEAMTDGLGGTPLDRWDPHEPLLSPWDVEDVTEEARSQMPESEVLLAGNGFGAFAQIQVRRTRVGLLEQVIGGVPVDDDTDVTDLLDVAAEALETVAGTFLVTVGLVSLSVYDGGEDVAVQGAHTRVPEAPLAMVIGSRTRRDLDLDVPRLSREFDLRVVGDPAGGPGSVLVRLSGPDGLWDQLARFGGAVGLDKVLGAAGVQVRDAH